MSGFAPLLGEKQTSDAPTPSADFMSTHRSLEQSGHSLLVRTRQIIPAAIFITRVHF